MSYGELYARALFSTLKYDGAPVLDRFYETLVDQELIMFLTKDDKNLNANSTTIEADATDIYFVIVRSSVDNPTTEDYTDEPVICCKAGETLIIAGVQVRGIKLSNDLGAKLYINGSKY
jgi:hypothetical protein